MEAAPLTMQRNWAGMLALYATAPAQPLLVNPIKGVSNRRAGGSWVKATSNARLRIHESHQAGCTVELHLNEDVLLRCPLQNQLLSMNLLPSSSTGSTSILVITPKQQSKEWTAAPVCYCFRFFDDSDCSTFRSALEAAKSNSRNRLQKQVQQPAPRQYQAADTLQQQQHLAATGAEDAATGAEDVGKVHAEADVMCGGVSAAVPPVAGSNLGNLSRSDMVPGMSQAQIKDTIKDYLLDPAFHSYVDEVDALWQEVEQEILSQPEGEEANVAAMQL